MVNQIPVREGIFVEGPDGGALLANKCKSCGQVFFPKTKFCLSCFHEDLEAIRLSRRGILYSYTIVHMPSTHFTAPYAVGYIDLPEDVRIFAPLIITEDEPFEVGMLMEVMIEQLWEEDGKEVIGYRFKPV